ncbi:7,8-dihydro-8-oxoguanine triphosphatase [Ktedonobacteria bacterium brp13]|nr:7,8-dihydro-8-oxoguanine triphosphatase [Ktedonobacteria bacterium brp13]
MLYRSNPPNANRWNGLGGKIETGETPLSNIHREMMEEAEIDLHQAQELRFAGLVTWTVLNTHTPSRRGMYAFLAHLAPNFPIEPDRLTPEGLLSWKKLDWVCDRSNPAVVDNIPYFLPQMLAHPNPQEYYCSYQDGVLQAIATGTLPDNLSDSEVFRSGGMVNE